MEVFSMYSNLEIKHYGVKGMKWGVRRDQSTLDRLAGRRPRATGGTRAERKEANRQERQNWKEFKSKYTRKELRSMRKDAVASRGEYIVDQVLKDTANKFVLVPDLANPAIKTMHTGEEFIEHLSRGGYMDARFTEIVTSSDLGLQDQKS